MIDEKELFQRLGQVIDEVREEGMTPVKVYGVVSSLLKVVEFELDRHLLEITASSGDNR